MSKKKIIVGSRESKLAVIQSELVMEQIKAHHPELELELVTMKTTGDKILDKTLDKIGGKRPLCERTGSGPEGRGNRYFRT